MVRWVAGCVAAGSVALIGGGLALAYLDRHLVPASLTAGPLQHLQAAGERGRPGDGLCPCFQAAREPDWLAVPGGGAGAGPGYFSNPYALHALVADRGSLAAGRVLVAVQLDLGDPVAMLAFLFLLFPTGRLRSRRWRPAAWFVGGAFAFATAGTVIAAHRPWAHPFAWAARIPAGLAGCRPDRCLLLVPRCWSAWWRSLSGSSSLG